ncbi:MAG: PorP/SprF family type IX secretion system membrane protein [Bacteroidales bacterium]|nr:PorP/SprF family type IX secretion system membrane protein [Bacteroidales bacterium]
MHKRIIILLVAVLGLSVMRVQAQDPMFSQFYANPLFLNPAMAGTNVCPRLAFNFRDQWPSMPGTFMTYAASYDEHFDKIYGGIGVQFWGDRAGEGGILNTYNASAMYSFKVKVSKKFNMRFALQAAFQNKSLDWSKLTFGDMIDPRYGFVYSTNENIANYINHINTLDFSFGFLGYTPHVYFGFAAKHIATLSLSGKTTPYSFLSGNADGNFYDMLKLTAHVGANFDLKRKSKKETSFGDISISPNFIYEHQLGFNYFSEGLYMKFYPFTVGVWCRHGLTYKYDEPMLDQNGNVIFGPDSITPMTQKTNIYNSDAIIFMFGLEYNMFKVAYSYDLTISRLASATTGGSHEVSVQVLLPCPKKRKAIKDLKCPSF